MPWMNYCKKCKAEVSASESCPHCGGRLAKTGERLSFLMARLPVRDWFAWNQVLRAALPALLLVAVVTLLAEGMASGGRGIQALFLQGFFWALMGALGGMLLVMLVIFSLQGKEYVRFVLDKDGVHAFTYLENITALRLYARFLTWASVEAMEKDMEGAQGPVPIRRADIAWQSVSRVRCWRENGQLLFFRPSWWQVMVVSCPAGEYAEAEAFVRKKLARNKKAIIVPKKP